MAAPLPVGKILAGAFLIPWWNRKAFARALAIPLASLATLTLSWYFMGRDLPGYAGWVLCIAYWALFTLFAVVCHRLVLLDPAAVARTAMPRWSRREGLFLGWTLAAGFLYGVTWLVLVTVAINVVPKLPGTGEITFQQWHEWLEPAAKIPALYLFARLSPLFPATAVDRRVDLQWAWRLTHGNGWRLVVVVGVLPWVISQLLGLLYRGNATEIETVVLSLAGMALFAIEIAALSISYRELTKES